ncbi:carbonic anhydrase [Halenospora varia]|nr:carbonic anhydrase [Halenospora varia]
MLSNAPTIIQTPYIVLPVPRDLIPSQTSSEEPSPGCAQESAAEQKRTHILWVGCSDSSVTETDCVDVGRDEMFVHRNLGHLLSNGDLSSRSAVEWSVELLKVEHIVVCGHYDCSLIAQHENEAAHGWYRDVAKLHHLNDAHLSSRDIELDERDRHRQHEEVYVLAEVEWLKRQECVANAIKERGIKIHAFVYDREIEGCVQLVKDEKVGSARENGSCGSEVKGVSGVEGAGTVEVGNGKL